MPAVASIGPFPDQPADVPWPTTEWSVADLPADVDPAAIDAAVEEAFNAGKAERVGAVLIVHRGAIVYERYSPNPEDGPEVVAPSYSMSKSVLSALIGILVRDGRLDITAPASVPEWHADADDPRAATTVEHMLHMATGIPWVEDPAEPDSDLDRMGNSVDRAAYAASLGLADRPGSVFDYSSGTSMVLARLFGEIVGPGPDDVWAFMDRELFGRIGMTSVVVDYDMAGTWVGAYGTNATARDFARFGLLYLRGGAWDGEQIVPSAWVDYSRTPSPANAEYGAQWWLDLARPGVMIAQGAFGQFIAVDPTHDVVVVQLGHDLPFDAERPLVDLVLDLFAGEP
jgi:CubicO group peptidase (beta-lactamase class C family)